MVRYVIRRLILMIPVLIGVTIIIFTMTYFTPGDPARLILGDIATEEQVQELREEMGLNEPFLTRYFLYVKGLFQGDLGVSYTTGLPVSAELAARLPTTIKLALISMSFAVVVGVPIGIISAVRQYSFLDNIATVLALMGITMPNFWLALLLILFFSVRLELLPPSGLYGPEYYIMPVIGISAASLATFSRMTRSSMLEVIRQDYIRTARSKGLSETVIIFKHALKNALIPIITVVGLQTAGALSGAVVNETIFAIPGMGKLMLDAIKNRNYPLVQGGVLIIALLYSLINLIVDLIYAFVDPRIKTQYKKDSKDKKNGSVPVLGNSEGK